MKKRTVRRLIFIPLGILVGLFGLVIGGVALVLTPERLTPLVMEVCDRHLDAQVRFDTVSLSLFRNFPHVTVQLRGAEVVSRAFDGLEDSLRRTMPGEADTLARLRRLDVSVNPWRLISGEVDVRRVALEGTHLHAYVAPDGTANWEIYRSDSAEEADGGDSTALAINVDRISIRGGLHAVYDNRVDGLSGEVELRSFQVRGRLSTDLLQNDLRRLRLRACAVTLRQGDKLSGAVIDSLTVDGRRQVDYTVALGARDLRWEGVRWLDSLRFGTGLLFHGADHRAVTVRDLALRLNDMAVTGGGEVAFRGDSIVASGMRVETRGMRLASLLRVVPTEVLPLARDYETDLTTDIAVRIDGPFVASAGELPDVTADWRIPAGYLYYTKGQYGSRIDTLAVDATLRYRPRRPDSTGVELRDFRVSGIGLNLSASGRAERLLGDAEISGQVRGDLSLDYLTEHFPSTSGTTVRGRVAMDLRGKTKLSQLDLGRIGGARIGGHVTVDTLLVDVPARDFHLMVGHGRIGAGTGLTRSDSLMARGMQAVGATLSLDTVDMDLGPALCVQGRKIRVHATTSARTIALDTTAVHPAQGVLSASGLRIELGDSTIFVGRGLESRWSILPTPGAPRTPRLALDIEARRLSLREAASRFVVRQGSVALDATLYRADSAQSRRREHLLDSLQRLYPTVRRDSLFAHVRALRGGGQRQRPVDELAGSDIDMRVSSDLGELLRRWQVNGLIRARAGRIVTPWFPMVTRLRDVNIGFNTDEVRLNRTFVKSGQSQMLLTGNIRGLRRAMLGRGRIRGQMRVEADTLNLNEIVRVAHAGAELMAQGGVGETESDDLFEARLAESVDTTAVADGSAALFVVPGNIDMTFDMTVRHGVYANLALDSLVGEVVARNRVLQLSNLVMRSNAGDLRMTGLYATRTKQDIQAGFDLEMERMQVARLIELIPAIDSLMPMLRSFDGVVDCQIAATTQLDSTMNILLPTLNAACHLEGDSLVLMDGETFAEISKMLMFKNKKRNLIDHISAEVLVRDSQVEVFPFVVEIDRYRAAVSGVHKMDLTFNYHISVLKSPIPFRLGIDIFGNLDDFDFRITRARYKSANLPTRVALIEDTRVNLRNYLREVFLHGPRTEDRARLRITPETVSPTELLPPADSLSAAEADSIGIPPAAVVPMADSTGGR